MIQIAGRFAVGRECARYEVIHAVWPAIRSGRRSRIPPASLPGVDRTVALVLPNDPRWPCQWISRFEILVSSGAVALHRPVGAMVVLITAFHVGFGIGLAVALPIGPMGLLCIQRTLDAGLGAGVMTGLGAATVHAAYGAAAILGLKAATIAVVGAGTPVLQLFSAVLLVVFAVRLLRRQGALGAARGGTALPFHAYYRDALILGIANPLTLVLLAAAIPSLAGLGDEVHAPVVLLGLFCGSVAWWLTLSTSVSLLRAQLSAGALRWINVAAGMMLAAMALQIVTRAMPY